MIFKILYIFVLIVYSNEINERGCVIVCILGCAASGITTPLDVAKTRIMLGKVIDLVVQY